MKNENSDTNEEDCQVPQNYLPIKVRLVKAMVFPVVMYGCESWTVKKAECRRVDGDLTKKERQREVQWCKKRTFGTLSKDVLGAGNYLLQDLSDVTEDAISAERREHFPSTLLFNSLFHRLEVN